jgi:ABC-type branched-subunit amino acid transport system substrate-binding protein
MQYTKQVVKKRVQDKATRDARILLAEIDKMVARRLSGNPVLPPILCIQPHGEESAARLIPNHYWISANAKKPTIPHVLSILDRPELDDLSLFVYIYENVLIPRSMGHFTFSNLKMAIDILGQTLDPSATSRKAKIDDLVTKLYNKPHTSLASRSANLLSTEDGYDGLLGFVAVILEVFRRFRFKIFRTKLATTPRYRWFTDRVALELTRQEQIDETSNDFLSYAVWTLQRPGLQGSAFARELLMLALFEDLEQAFKPRPINLSWRRRRRTTPFVITLKDVCRTDSAGRRFLQTFGELMDQSRGSSLLLLASVNGQPPKSLLSDTDTFHTATDKIQLIRHGRYESSAITAFNIQASYTPAQMEETRQFIDTRPTPKPKISWRDFTLLTVLGILLTPFILAACIYAVRIIPVLYQSTQSCRYMRDQTSEVVGITDGSCSFLTARDARSIGYSETENPLWRQFQVRSDGVKDLFAYIGSLGTVTPPTPDAYRLSYIRELNEAKGVILAQNKHIKEGDNYRTIVLLLPFTAPDESGQANQKTIGITRGVAVAQEEINANADRASPGSLQHLKLKVLIANTGNKLSHGQTVAHDIRELNKNGLTPLTPRHSIVAVAGITQSLAEAKRTVNILTAPGDANNPPIPVIGSTLTYDYMSEEDPLFYQTSAPNKRQAQVLAEFIRRQPLVGDVSGTMPHLLKPAQDLVMVSDNNDWYSQNLADDIINEFSRDNRVLRHWAMAGGKDEDSDPHLIHKPEVLSLSMIQSKLCNPTELPTFDQQRDVIVYTGRSQNFSTFLSALKPDVCSRGKGFTIVAGSDIAQWGEYDAFKSFFPHLYFSAYGSRDSVHNGAVADNFFANPTVKDVVDQSGSARAYDSIKLIWTVVQSTKLPVKAIDTVAIIKSFSSKPSPSIRFEGASGVIDIPSGQQVPVNKPVFIMRAGKSQPVLSCGVFSIQPPGSALRLNTHGQPFFETKWGDTRQFDCPEITQ